MPAGDTCRRRHLWDPFIRPLPYPDFFREVFDVGRKSTYKNLSQWYAELREHCPNIPTIVCANKIDSESAPRTPSQLEQGLVAMDSLTPNFCVGS